MSELTTTRSRKSSLNTAVPATTADPARHAICKLCHMRIQPGQPRLWSSEPAGLCHTGCVPAARA